MSVLSDIWISTINVLGSTGKFHANKRTLVWNILDQNTNVVVLLNEQRMLFDHQIEIKKMYCQKF